MLQKLGPGEGQVNILAWPGYAEDGSNDPKVNWVKPFEQQTGCKANVKYFGTSDEAVNLMKSGGYDVVSASGDASLRLVASGQVAPVNTALVPNYADIQPFLKDRAWNSVGKQMYGIPHGWGANLLMYRTDKVKPAPTSWGEVFAKNSPYSGKITAYDSPIYIADAALYLMKTKPSLKITNPYALDQKQLAAAVSLLKVQRPQVSEYWSDYLKEVQSFKTGDSEIGTTWQVITSLAQSEKVPVQSVLPQEGATGWSDTWMVAAKSQHPNCAYQWMNYIVSPKVNAQVAEYFGEAPANAKACAETTDKSFCDTYHASDAAFASRIWYWTTPIAQCLDGRTNVRCTDYSAWTQAWTEVKG
jgi:putative spermidine/putrescine transport system substrate-binding protein